MKAYPLQLLHTTNKLFKEQKKYIDYDTVSAENYVA